MPEQELDRLQGTWRIHSLEFDGAELPKAMLIGSQITIDGATFLSETPQANYGGRLVLDPAANPKCLDLNFNSGPHAGESSYGIYELDGDDMKLCLCLAGGTRPESFTTSPGSGHALETLRRQG